MDYAFHLLIIISIYVVLATSLNLLWGYTGLLSFGHAAFFGIGAYTAALLTIKLGLGFALGTLLGIALAMLVGVAIAVVTIRMGGDYFILAVLGFQVVISSVLMNWVDMTRGDFGLYGIAKANLFSWTLTNPRDYFILTAAVAVAVYFLAQRLVNSPFGRVLKAIREDEVAALVLAKNVVRFKILVFAIGAGLAAVAGSLLAHYFTALHPTSFTLEESILIVTIVIFGGSGSLKGSILGVLVLLVFPESLRFLKLPGDVTGPVQQITYGLLLLLFMIYRPQGLIGEYKI